jgi:hypothetical protein
MILRCVLASVLLSAATAAPALADRWLPGDGRSCVRVCSEAGAVPVRSGAYRNGNAFTVCRADVNGEGRRPGYNLQPDWSRACFVAYGGKELPVRRYDCMCER